MKWAKRLGLILVASLVGLVVGGVAFEQWSRHAAVSRFAPPGKKVEFDGAESHLYCTGSGTPTVILESGLDTDGALGWSRVQPKIAEVTRVCSYDRAGYMWSAERGGVRDGRTIANELRALLAKAAEPPPYVMVGHSLGGALVRVFAAAAERGAVQGFVFVDASHPDLLKRDPNALQGPPEALMTMMGALGVLRLMDEGSPDLPEDARRPVAALGPQGGTTWLAEARAIPETFSQAAATGTLGERPLVVLTALDKPPERQALWRDLQDDLAALSTNRDHRIISDGGHYLQHERPYVVVAAVRDVVTAVREAAPLRRTPP
jgi:pimeloyl-ACP methyl ester carboxylesterase